MTSKLANNEVLSDELFLQNNYLKYDLIWDLFYFSLCLSCRFSLSPDGSGLAAAHTTLQGFCDETADHSQK